ncbi:MAG: hypothetical protein KZQ93_01980 [Candidatus Thiodiazotropha sp. (ex Monitilora ramsayi)]|nr:hypothetical protein [Candidatus Thiodiazotropha sp. (ex Monitilora ramsayi)]
MKTRYSHRSPDFFAVLLVLVVVGFGMTLAVQIGTSDRDRMVDTEVVQVNPNAG